MSRHEDDGYSGHTGLGPPTAREVREEMREQRLQKAEADLAQERAENKLMREQISAMWMKHCNPRGPDKNTVMKLNDLNALLSKQLS